MIIQNVDSGEYYKFISIDDTDGIGWTLRLEHIQSNERRVKRSYTVFSLDQIIEQLQRYVEVSPGEINL